MATATTMIGPIRAIRINSTLYAGETGIPTIQAGVDYAAEDGGTFAIVIPPGYPGTEAINTIVNGSSSIMLSDRRTASAQSYTWDGHSYIPASFSQAGDIITAAAVFSTGGPQIDVPPGSVMLSFDPNATGGNGSADLRVTGVEGKTQPAFNLQVEDSDGSNFHTFIRCEQDPTTLTPLLILPQDTEISGSLTVPNIEGNVNIDGTVSAVGAQFETCIVDDSPVRTFANSSDGGGMIFPVPGIAVSAGDSWQDPSIDPATIAYLNQPNTFTDIQTFNENVKLSTGGGVLWGDAEGSVTLSAQSPGELFLNFVGGSEAVNFCDGDGVIVASVNVDGDASFNECIVDGSPVRTFENTPDGGGGGPTYPPAGVPQSTGTSWGTSFPAASLAFTTQPNTFTELQTFNERLGFSTGGGLLWGDPLGSVVLSAARPGALMLNFVGGTSVNFCDGNGGIVAGVDYGGNAEFNACQVGGSPVRTFANTPDGGGGPTYPPAGVPQSTGTSWGTSFPAASLVFTNHLNTFAVDQTFNESVFLSTGGGVLSGDAGGSVVLSAETPGALFLNFMGGNAVNFCDGDGGVVASVDYGGNAAFPACQVGGSGVRTFANTPDTRVIQSADEATAISNSQANPNNIYFWV